MQKLISKTIRSKNDTKKPSIKSCVAQRICLKCNQSFLSQGPGNRICPNCTKINAKFGHIPESVLARERGVKRRNGEIIERLEDLLDQ